ncbi:MAG: HAMP domain-containing protein [Dehalococcoidia bacterium]|nr:HAMP domain-containing protein [Dehalococcoidia bacterium]
MTGPRLPGAIWLRLFLSYLAVSCVGLLALFLTVRLTAPSFFDQHIAAGMGLRGQGGTRMAELGADLDQALVDTINQGFLLAFAIALPLSVLASIVVARSLSQPLNRLAAASTHIAAGDYSQRLPVAGADEYRQVAAGFNSMAAALEDVERRRVALIGDIAHELRTPVAVLRGYIEGLADGVFAPNSETWALLGEETGRITRLLDELRELSRAESGQLELHPTRLEPADLLAETESRFAPAARERGLALSIDAPAALPVVVADRDRVLQVLSNLTANALHYTEAPGSVRLRARRDGGHVCFAVEDTGIGIAADELPLVFERFYRTDPSRSRRSGGAGIGLTIAHALVVAMGGTIDAASDGPGRGATFTVRLPAAP